MTKRFRQFCNIQNVVKLSKLCRTSPQTFWAESVLVSPLFLPAPQFVFPYFFRFIVMHYISPLSFLSSLFSANVFFWRKREGNVGLLSLFILDWKISFLRQKTPTKNRSKFASLSSAKKNSVHGKNDPKVSLQAHFFVETSAVWVGWWVPNQKNLLIALLFDTLGGPIMIFFIEKPSVQQQRHCHQVPLRVFGFSKLRFP